MLFCAKMLLNYLYFCFTTLSYDLILQQPKQLNFDNSSARNNTARGTEIYYTRPFLFKRENVVELSLLLFFNTIL